MDLASLRQATSSLHQDLESRIDFLSPDLTVDRYIRILQAFFAFYEPMEAEIYARCPAQYRSLWQGRRRAHRLLDDLAALGAAPTDAPAGSFKLPDLSDPGQWLGAVYVLEGSTLGGQVISRHLEEHFGWSDGRGYTFFKGHGAQTGDRWREVLKAIEAHSAENNQVVFGAHQTFNQMIRCVSALL